MVSIASLWLPILLSAVLVFIVSSIVHMVLGYHRADMRRLPDEAGVQEALRKFDLAPGDYMLPCPENMQAMKSPEFVEKRNRGPVLVMTVMKSGTYAMGSYLIKWFLYSLLIGVLAAYVTGRALPAGSPYLTVFRFAGITT